MDVLIIFYFDGCPNYFPNYFFDGCPNYFQQQAEVEEQEKTVTSVVAPLHSVVVKSPQDQSNVALTKKAKKKISLTLDLFLRKR